MYLQEENVNVFEDKWEAYDFWKNNGGYFLILTDGDEGGYVVENPENDFSNYEEIRDMEEITFTQVIRYQSDDLFPYVDIVIYEEDFLKRADLYAV